MSSFAGMQAMVTGAGSGIGAALCRALIGEGAHVLARYAPGLMNRMSIQFVARQRATQRKAFSEGTSR